MNSIFQAKTFSRIPDGTLIDPFLNPKDSFSNLPFDLLDDFSLTQGRIKANSSSKIHVHPHVDQVTFVLSGKITLKMKGKQDKEPYEIELESQQSAISKGGDFFQLINPHEEDCEVLYIVSPAYLFELDDKKEVAYDDSITLPYTWEELKDMDWEPEQLGLEKHSRRAREKAYMNIKNRKTPNRMKLVSAYLIGLLLSLFALLLFTLSDVFSTWMEAKHIVIIQTGLAGGFGAISYCLWALYVHCCRKQDWDDLWLPWYFIRPVLGMIIGGFTYFLVATGLLVLEASSSGNVNYLGVYVLAFIAGLNTDRFIAKIEGIASNLWGIEPSSLSKSYLEKEIPQKESERDKSGNKEGHIV